jgi:hypothetical protein
MLKHGRSTHKDIAEALEVLAVVLLPMLVLVLSAASCAWLLPSAESCPGRESSTSQAVVAARMTRQFILVLTLFILVG